MLICWAVVTDEKEFEIFETKEAAETYQKGDLGDFEAEYSHVVETVIMKKTEYDQMVLGLKT